MKHSMDGELRQLLPKDYPEGLLQIPQVPERLWIRGELPKTGTKLLAVVGSRAQTPYGKRITSELIQGLKGYPIAIVSGLALGTDASAHQAALDTGLQTIAVLASGLRDEAIGPRVNFPLAMDMLRAGGALLTENPPEYSPFPSDFPKRNRIVAGLSDAILVIEAGERSGTLITARLASEYNRELLCVPHRAGDVHSSASEVFIRLGATPVTQSSHILEALRINVHAPQTLELSENERIIYDALETPLRKEDLLARSKLASTLALKTLITLELRGVVQQKFGTWRRVSQTSDA